MKRVPGVEMEAEERRQWRRVGDIFVISFFDATNPIILYHYKPEDSFCLRLLADPCFPPRNERPWATNTKTPATAGGKGGGGGDLFFFG